MLMHWPVAQMSPGLHSSTSPGHVERYRGEQDNTYMSQRHRRRQGGLMHIDSTLRTSFVLIESPGNITPPHKHRNGSAFVISRLSEHKMHCPFGALNGVLANRKTGRKWKGDPYLSISSSRHSLSLGKLITEAMGLINCRSGNNCK